MLVPTLSVGTTPVATMLVGAEVGSEVSTSVVDSADVADGMLVSVTEEMIPGVDSATPEVMVPLEARVLVSIVDVGVLTVGSEVIVDGNVVVEIGRLVIPDDPDGKEAVSVPLTEAVVSGSPVDVCEMPLAVGEVIEAEPETEPVADPLNVVSVTPPPVRVGGIDSVELVEVDDSGPGALIVPPVGAGGALVMVVTAPLLLKTMVEDGGKMPEDSAERTEEMPTSEDAGAAGGSEMVDAAATEDVLESSAVEVGAVSETVSEAVVDSAGGWAESVPVEAGLSPVKGWLLLEGKRTPGVVAD